MILFPYLPDMGAFVFQSGRKGAFRKILAAGRAAIIFVGIPVLLLWTNCRQRLLTYRVSALVLCLAGCALSFPLAQISMVRKSALSCCLMFAGCFFVYCQCGEVAWRAQVRYGMPRDRVQSVAGTLSSDSSISANGNQVYRLVAGTCYGKDGSVASMRGELTVVGKSLPILLAGTRVICFGSCPADDDTASEAFFFADTVEQVPENGWFGPAVRACRMRSLAWIAQRFDVAIRWSATPEETPDTQAAPETLRHRACASRLAMMLVTGRCDDPSFPLRELSLACGCAHILALSGTHLRFFESLFSLLFERLFGRRRGRAFAMVPVLMFLFVAGPLPSLIRSAFMYALGFVPVLSGTGHLSSSVIYAVSFVLQLVLFPHSISTAGCLFSYAALGGLLAVSADVAVLLSRFLPRRIAGELASATLAVGWSIPCSLLVFGSWTPVGILISPLVTRAVMGYLALSVVALCVGEIPILEHVVMEFMERGYRAIENLMRWGGNFAGRWCEEVGDATGAIVFCAALLTVSLAILYAGKVLHIRSLRRHELELCVRFPICDHGVAGGRGPFDVEEVRPELPLVAAGTGTDRTGATDSRRRDRVGNRAGPRCFDDVAGRPKRTSHRI